MARTGDLQRGADEAAPALGQELLPEDERRGLTTEVVDHHLRVGGDAVPRTHRRAWRAGHAHDERHVIDAAERGHRREAGQPEEEVCLGVVVGDRLAQHTEAAALRLHVLGVDVIPAEVGADDAAHARAPRGGAGHGRDVDRDEVRLHVAQKLGLALDNLLLALEELLVREQALHAVDSQCAATHTGRQSVHCHTPAFGHARDPAAPRQRGAVLREPARRTRSGSSRCRGARSGRGGARGSQSQTSRCGVARRSRCGPCGRLQ
eukprot:45681-Prymnesium_polylepis.3